MAKLPGRSNLPDDTAISARYGDVPRPIRQKTPAEIEQEEMEHNAAIMRKASGKSSAELLKMVLE